jgi:hypothetical protein
MRKALAFKIFASNFRSRSVQKFFTFADFQAKSRERGQIAVLDFLQYFLIKQKVRKKLILSFSRVGRFSCEFHNYEIRKYLSRGFPGKSKTSLPFG